MHLPGDRTRAAPKTYFAHRPIHSFRPTKLATALVLSGTAIWFASFSALVFIYGDPKGPGEAGDVFGAANALFSVLAFSGIVLTLIFQNRQTSVSLAFELLKYHFDALRGTPPGIHTKFVQLLRATATPERVTAEATADDQLLRDLRGIRDSVDSSIGECLELIHHANTTVNIYGLLRVLDAKFIPLLWAQMTNIEIVAVFYFLMADSKFHGPLKTMVLDGLLHDVADEHLLFVEDRRIVNVL